MKFKKYVSVLITGAIVLSSVPVNADTTDLLLSDNVSLTSDNVTSGSSVETGVTKYTGTAHVDQFGEYDVNVTVSVLNGIITSIEVEGANFGGTYAEYNKTKLQSAVDGLKEVFTGISSNDASSIDEIDAVTGATVSSKAIKTAILNALNLSLDNETVDIPTSLTEGEYTVDISFYTDTVKHSLVENETITANISVDSNGKATLTTDIINNTEKEPLYTLDFNGYYENNDTTNPLKTDAVVTKSDVDYSDDVLTEDTQVVTKVSFPLEGEYAAKYTSNVTMYVPAMKNLTGTVAGVVFDQGRFSADAITEINWNTLASTNTTRKTYEFGKNYTELQPNTYILPVSMMKSTDITSSSMAGSCIGDSTITVADDGSAIVNININPVSVFGQTAYSKDWKVYQGTDTASALLDADFTTDENGNVNNITFTLPDNSFDGVYVNMNSGFNASDAYLALDYANATAVRDAFSFGSSNTNLQTGTYSIPVSLKNASNIANNSMASSAVKSAEIIVDSNGTATIKANLGAVSFAGLTAWATNWKVYQGNSTNSESVFAAETVNDSGDVTNIEFTLPDNSFDGVYVNMFIDAMGYAPDAYLALDYANAIVVTPTPSESTSETTTVTSESTSETTTVTSESTSETTTVTSESTSETTTATSESTSETTTAATSESTSETTTAATSESTSETTTNKSSSGGGAGGSLKVAKTTTTEAITETVTEETTEDITSSSENSLTVANVRVSANNNTVKINNKNYTMDVSPYIQSTSNSMLVPLRFVVLALSNNIEDIDNNEIIIWNSETKTAIIKYNNKTIKFKADSNIMIVDGTPQLINNGVKPEITNGRMFVPFRALGEALNINVEWDEEAKTASYTTK